MMENRDGQTARLVGRPTRLRRCVVAWCYIVAAAVTIALAATSFLADSVSAKVDVADFSAQPPAVLASPSGGDTTAAVVVVAPPTTRPPRPRAHRPLLSPNLTISHSGFSGVLKDVVVAQHQPFHYFHFILAMDAAAPRRCGNAPLKSRVDGRCTSPDLNSSEVSIAGAHVTIPMVFRYFGTPASQRSVDFDAAVTRRRVKRGLLIRLATCPGNYWHAVNEIVLSIIETFCHHGWMPCDGDDATIRDWSANNAGDALPTLFVELPTNMKTFWGKNNRACRCIRRWPYCFDHGGASTAPVNVTVREPSLAADSSDDLAYALQDATDEAGGWEEGDTTITAPSAASRAATALTSALTAAPRTTAPVRRDPTIVENRPSVERRRHKPPASWMFTKIVDLQHTTFSDIDTAGMTAAPAPATKRQRTRQPPTTTTPPSFNGTDALPRWWKAVHVDELITGLRRRCGNAAGLSKEEYPYFIAEADDSECHRVMRVFRALFMPPSRRNKRIVGHQGGSITTAVAGKKILVVRRETGLNGRGLTNYLNVSAAIVAVAQELNATVTSVFLESLPTASQLELVRDADVLIAARGAATVYAMLQKPRSVFVSMFPVHYLDVAFDNDNYPWLPSPYFRGDIGMLFLPCPYSTEKQRFWCKMSTVNFCDMQCSVDRMRDLVREALAITGTPAANGPRFPYVERRCWSGKPPSPRRASQKSAADSAFTVTSSMAPSNATGLPRCSADERLLLFYTPEEVALPIAQPPQLPAAPRHRRRSFDPAKISVKDLPWWAFA